jgi:hypothetical protein
MKALREAVGEYLALRRSLGFKLEYHESCLRKFISFFRKKRSAHLSIRLALQFATQHQHQQPALWAARLRVVRGFARYLSDRDPRTEIRCCRGNWSVYLRPKAVPPRLVFRARLSRESTGSRNWKSKSTGEARAPKRNQRGARCRTSRSRIPVGCQGHLDERPEYRPPPLAAGGVKTKTQSQESHLARTAHFLRNMDGPVGRKSERRTGPDASESSFNHDGHLRAVRS